MATRLRAQDAVTKLDEVRLHLQNASRVNPDSPSIRALRDMMRDPEVLDALEAALNKP